MNNDTKIRTIKFDISWDETPFNGQYYIHAFKHVPEMFCEAPTVSLYSKPTLYVGMTTVNGEYISTYQTFNDIHDLKRAFKVHWYSLLNIACVDFCDVAFERAFLLCFSPKGVKFNVEELTYIVEPTDD